MPKIDLVDHAPRQIVSGDDWSEFRLRLGQRYTRDAVPEELVKTVERPVKKVVFANKNRELADHFTDFLLREEEGQPMLRAVTGLDYTQDQGEDAYDELEREFPDEVVELLHPGSGAVHITDLHFLVWLKSTKLGLDAASFDPKRAGPDTSPPTR